MMANRIRIIWPLSLVAALLIIGLQGYWLYNRHLYMVDRYAQELAEKILKVGEDEYVIRQMPTRTEYKYSIHKQSEYKGKTDSTRAVQKTMQQFQIHIDMPDTTKFMSLSIHWNPGISEEELQTGVNRLIAEKTNPFRPQLLDSLLTARLPDLDCTTAPWHATDSTHCISHWEHAGNAFKPQITAYYAYNPLERQGVAIHAAVPVEPVLQRMAVQWLITLGLTLLLVACFASQIDIIFKQQKLSELREHFANTMAHELRRPVQTLKTFLAFLGDREMRSNEHATKQVVQDAMFELDNLSVYLDKLKDMLRADSESTVLNRTRFDLPALIEKVIRLTPIPDGKTVRFTTACDMHGAPLAEADPVHIANVLNNLVENAVKYSGCEVDVEVRASRRGKGIHLTVTDTGIGIPPAEQSRVFDKFYRGAAPDVPGLGLGLSYVKLIVRAHQGDITLQSHPGTGTTITIFLPQ